MKVPLYGPFEAWGIAWESGRNKIWWEASVYFVGKTQKAEYCNLFESQKIWAVIRSDLSHVKRHKKIYHWNLGRIFFRESFKFCVNRCSAWFADRDEHLLSLSFRCHRDVYEYLRIKGIHKGFKGGEDRSELKALLWNRLKINEINTITLTIKSTLSFLSDLDCSRLIITRIIVLFFCV